MKVFIRIAEILLGIIFLGAGLNGYVMLLGFDAFAPTSPAAMEFLGDGYLLAIEKGVEIIAGFLLLIRRFVPLALVVLASIVINILAFHIFVDSEILPLAILVTLLEGVLAWFYRESFKGLLESKPNVH
ncbi:hypothetical protein CV093_20580 [Oceanobacillus sp. 143]|uniref:DoxX family membrane protein n=1 Tax=Oceanobacillus zhaokaii TaxID=2052660 RepID=A0A345PLM8_9BACI|nr:hypothetical protein [Oceanobacillus zhaokaii]AXI10908.1 hypothetical protein CUC15_19110 [Oceanobacillus zhaokaii]QGS69753.1 hypothetical protein CV093_20580 [Oceanobacillus sp. 143]